MPQDAQGLSALSASDPPQQRDGFTTDCASPATPAGLASLSLETGLCRRVSPAFEALLGYDPGDLDARHYLELVHDQDRRLTEQALDQLKAGEPLSQFENRFRSKTGPYRWLFWTATTSDFGHSLLLTATDLTVTSIYRHSIQEHQDRYRTLLDAVTSYTYSVTLENGKPAGTVHGEGCLSTTGFTPDDFAEKPYLWIEIVHPDDRELVRDHVARILRGENPPPLEHRIQHRDRSIRWIRDTTVIHRKATGEIDRYDGLVEDVTDRKKLQERFRKLLESAPDAMVVVGQEGRMVLVNERTEALFGYTRRELLGQPVEMLLPAALRPAHESARSAFAAHPHQRAMGEGPNLRARRKDASEFPAGISLSPIETDDGLLVAASIRDLTRQFSLQNTVDTNLLIQSAIGRILQASLEPLALEDYLQRSLDEILSVPWFAGHANAAIYLVTDTDLNLSLKVQRNLPYDFVATFSTLENHRCLCGQPQHHPDIHYREPAEANDSENPGLPLPSQGLFCVPIAVENHLYGIINIFTTAFPALRMNQTTEFLASVSQVLAGTIDRKRAEAALQESKERFDLAVRGSNAGIWDWDLRTDHVYFSPRWKSIIGYDEHEIGNALFEWRDRLHPADLERAFQTINAYLKGRSSEYELEHRLRHKDGSYRWILARGAAVRDSAGQPYRMVGWHIDVTDHKHAVEQLNENLIQLNAAQKIQQSLLPTEAPRITGLDIAGASYPAAFTGGDLFDYLPMLGGSLGILIGDVSGHGLPSALLMTSTQAYLRCLAQTCTTVGEIMTRVNRFVHDETDCEHFVTLLLMRYNPRTRQMVYTNAGHPSGYVFDPSGRVKQELESASIPLGIKDHVDYPVREPTTLEVGDTVVLLTDGFLEAESPNGKHSFGEQRVLDTIKTVINSTSQQILEALHQAIIDFTAKPIPTDDLTAVVIKIDR